MSKEITVRFASKQDAPVLVEFNREMARETEGRELRREVISAGVQSLLDKSELGFYLVAEHENKIVGSLMITTEWSDWRNGLFWWIQSVYVLPDLRRQGIYRKLYSFVKDHAENNKNVCGFRLYVEKENLNAQKTYQSLGMSETEYKLYEEVKDSLSFCEKAA